MSSTNPFWLDKPLGNRAIVAGEKVLAAAAAYIAAKGASTMTVAAVAKQAGISNGSAYHVFPTRDGLLQAVYRRWAAGLNMALKSVEPSGKRPLRVFLEKDLLHAYCAWFKSERSRAAFMAEFEAQVGGTVWVGAFNNARSEMQEALRHSLRAYTALGNKPIDARILEAVVLGPVKLAIGAWVASAGGASDPLTILPTIATATAAALEALHKRKHG